MLSRGFLFFFWEGFSVGLVNGSLHSFRSNVNLTQVLDGNLSHSGPSCALVSLSLDTVVVGEVDELEEDVG